MKCLLSPKGRSYRKLCGCVPCFSRRAFALFHGTSVDVVDHHKDWLPFSHLIIYGQVPAWDYRPFDGRGVSRFPISDEIRVAVSHALHVSS